MIISGKASGFIAGADVKAFAEVPGVASAEQHIRASTRSCTVSNRWHSHGRRDPWFLPRRRPGTRTGLRLPCRCRRHCDGLGPEVRLGIFPAAPCAAPACGDLAALQLMLGAHCQCPAGTPHGAGRSGSAATPVARAAAGMIRRNTRPHRAGWVRRLPSLAALRPLVCRGIPGRKTGEPRPLPCPLRTDRTLARHGRRRLCDVR